MKMYTEEIEIRKTKISGVLFIVIAALALIALEGVAMAVRALSSTAAMVYQSLLIAFIVAFAIWYYRAKLSTFSYSVLVSGCGCEHGEDSECDCDGFEDVNTDCPEGTVYVCSCIGSSRTLICEVHPGDVTGFYEDLSQVPEGRYVKINAYRGGREGVKALTFCEDGKSYVLYFKPSERFLSLANVKK